MNNQYVLIRLTACRKFNVVGQQPNSDGQRRGRYAKTENRDMLAHSRFSSVRDEIRTHTAFRPLPPQSSVSTNSTTRTSKRSDEALSEKRDSNPRPRPWQGRALPTELFSQAGRRFFRRVRDEIRTHTAFRPLPPQSSVSTNSTTRTSKRSDEALSEKRDSNPRPRPWQGRALPTELFSQILFFKRICNNL